jgi:PAS domain S-box-containing protein
MEEHQGSPISPKTGDHLQAERGIKRSEDSQTHRSPLRLLVITIVAIFVAEVVAMIVVYELPVLPYYQLTLVDAGIMTIMIFPVLYFFSFRPLIRQMEKSWRAEESLLQSRELQEKFFDSINTLIAYMDTDFNFIRVNNAYAKTDGHEPEFFIGKNHFALYPHPENQAIFRQVVESGEAFTVYEKPFEYPEHPERGITYWDWSLQPVKGSNGIVEGLVLSLLDVTERRRAHDAIRQLSRIVEQAEDSVVVTDCDGIIEYVNPAFERLTGYAKQEILGKTPRLLKSGIQDDHFYQELWSTILRGQVFQREMANRKKNGELFYEVKTITPLRDADGNITNFVATGKDITEHKHDEEQLQQAYAELEVRVQTRTEELSKANSELEEEIMERRRVEEALREAEKRSQRAEEIAHLGSWELDLVKDRLIWSDEVYRIFGLQPQEFGASYEAFLEAVHPDDRAAVDSVYTASVRDGKDGYEIEHRVIRRSSGEVRIVHEKCEHFRNEMGQIIRSTGMVHDITERKRAEEALRRSEALLQQTGQMAKVGGWELDLQTMTLYWSPETYRIHEVDPSLQPTVEEAINFYTPEARPLIQNAVQQAIEKGIFYDLELQIVTAQGRLLWVRTIGQAEFRAGRCVRIFGTFQDITLRKHAQEELRRARDELELRVQERTTELAIANSELLNEITERQKIEQQLRIQTTAMEAAANGIVITDRQGNIQWTNPAFVQISGYEAADLIGQNMHIFRSGQHDAAFYSQMWDTILSGEVWQGEIINRRRDGRCYVEEQTITPVRGDHGEITQFIAIKQDITERKQAEKDIRERDQKEKILTQTIHTMQLDIARDLHDTIGQNISFLRMKLDHLAEKKIRKQAEIQLELQSMARAADESYDLMRGTLAVLQSANSSDLFRLFTRYAEQIEERSSFKIDLSSKGEPKFMSARRMRQFFYIFREILNNIEKHSNASQVTIEMIWGPDHLNLVVCDNGSGFDMEKVQYGSHYGLKFMRERAELLNGSLSIRSVAGSGTSIQLQVPYE